MLELNTVHCKYTYASTSANEVLFLSSVNPKEKGQDLHNI